MSDEISTKENIINKIIDVASERLKIPIISTYIVVLCFQNWDLLFYLIFQENTALAKIRYVQNTWGDLYWNRIISSLLYGAGIIIVFSIVDLVLTWCLKEVYKAKNNINEKIINFKLFDKLEEDLNKKNVDFINLSTEHNSLKAELKKVNLSNEKVLRENKTLKIFAKFGIIISNLNQSELFDGNYLYQNFSMIVNNIKNYLQENDTKRFSEEEFINYLNSKNILINNDEAISFILTVLLNNKILNKAVNSNKYIEFEVDENELKSLLFLIKNKNRPQ